LIHGSRRVRPEWEWRVLEAAMYDMPEHIEAFSVIRDPTS
jgi:hypothetical protein